MTLGIKDLEERSGQLERTGIRGLEMEVKDWKEEVEKGIVKEGEGVCLCFDGEKNGRMVAWNNDWKVLRLFGLFFLGGFPGAEGGWL